MHDSLPEGPFRTISADPPWPYGTSSRGHFVIPKPQDEVDRGHRGVETMGYEPMPMDEILALPVRDVADSSAHLYLWVTNAFIAEGMEVMAAWGFKYKTMLTWTKTQDSHPIRVSMKSPVRRPRLVPSARRTRPADRLPVAPTGAPLREAARVLPRRGREDEPRAPIGDVRPWPEGGMDDMGQPGRGPGLPIRSLNATAPRWTSSPPGR